MGASSVAATGNANLRPEQMFGKKDLAVRAMAGVMRKLQDLYTEKTAANIAARAGVSVRSAEYWISGDEAERRDMSGLAFIALLLDDDGAAILDGMMAAIPAKHRPRWWLRQSNTARLATIEQLQAAQEEEIKQLRLSLLK